MHFRLKWLTQQLLSIEHGDATLIFWQTIGENCYLASHRDMPLSHYKLSFPPRGVCIYAIVRYLGEVWDEFQSAIIYINFKNSYPIRTIDYDINTKKVCVKYI